jgi:hypothetical protein
MSYPFEDPPEVRLQPYLIKALVLANCRLKPSSY